MPPNPFPGVTGFLTPVMTGDLPNGEPLNAYGTQEEFDRVAKGYACGYCNAIFDTVRMLCPICKRATEATRIPQAAPELWQQHVTQRSAPIRTELIEGEREIELPPDVRRTSEMFFTDVGKDKDVEQTPLSKLKPSKWGRK